MQKTNSKYVIYRHVITGSYQVFETNNKKEAIRFIKSIRYQIIKKSPMDFGYYLVIKRQVRIQNNELLNWVKEQKLAQSLSAAESKKLWIMSLFGNVFVAGCALLYLLFADSWPNSLSDVMPALVLSVMAVLCLLASYRSIWNVDASASVPKEKLPLIMAALGASLTFSVLAVSRVL